ncbi:AAA family ATPase [Candidatus Uhrbacteria bacterium]|nr:AAA family ATPase [Candidatus Uhrbacteria bacterium]
MAKLIIGLTSMPGGGKGTAAKYLETKYGAAQFSFGGILADVLKRLALDKSRDNLQKLSTHLRQAFGEDVLAYAIETDAVSATADLVVIEGIRRPGDIVALEPLPFFKLIAIDVSPELRFQRMKQRGEKAGESDMTWEKFLAQESGEAERAIPVVMARASETVDNSGTLEEFLAKLDDLMARLGVAPKA